MLIIEGSDFLGKTVAARKLAEMIAKKWKGSPDTYYRHKTKPTAELNTLSWFMQNTGFRVADRFHLSSVAYGVALGAYNHTPAWEEMKALQRWLHWMGCVTIVFYAGDEWYSKLPWEDDQMYKREDAMLVNEVFKGLATGWNHGEPWCDFSHDVCRGWPTDTELDEWFSVWQERFAG